jgi:hypothetical protein
MVKVGCDTGNQWILLYNTCTTPITLKRGRLTAAAGYPPYTPPHCPGTTHCPEFFAGNLSELVLQPGPIPATISVHYLPLDYGQDTGSILVESDAGDVVVELKGNGGAEGIAVETFQVEAPPLVDWLVMIDPSPSFVSKRAGVRANLESLMRQWSGLSADQRWSFAPADGAPDAGVALLATGEGQTWFHSLDSTLTRDAGFIAEALAAFDTLPVGSEVEACIGPAVQVLSASGQGPRPGAYQSVICITDALEQSPAPSASLAALRALSPLHTTYSAVFGRTSSSCAIEAVDDGAHQALINTAGGVAAGICWPDWWVDFRPFEHGPCSQHTYYLRHWVDSVTLVVVDGQAVPAIDAQGRPAWHLDTTQRNALVFEAAHAPSPGSTLEVRYTWSCGP